MIAEHLKSLVTTLCLLTVVITVLSHTTSGSGAEEGKERVQLFSFNDVREGVNTVSLKVWSMDNQLMWVGGRKIHTFFSYFL